MSEIENTDPGRARSNAARLSSLMRRANTLAAHGNYDEAIERIKEAIAISPHNPKCSVQLAYMYRKQNRMEPAIDAMRRAVELDPHNSAVHEQFLRILVELGRYDEAISTSRMLIRQLPKSVFARDILGIAYLQQGMIDKALRVTNELIRIDPTDSAHYFKKAVLLQQKGEIAQAMDSFTRALEMDPQGEMSEEAQEAIAALDSFQLRQILTIAVEDAVFRLKLVLDPEPVLRERGFRLSSSGLVALRQLDLDQLPGDPQSRYYH